MIRPKSRLAYGNMIPISHGSNLMAFSQLFDFVLMDGTDSYLIEDIPYPKCQDKKHVDYDQQSQFVKNIRPKLIEAFNHLVQFQHKYSQKNLSNLWVSFVCFPGKMYVYNKI